MNPVAAAVVFTAVAIADVAYAKYTLATIERSAHHAAMWAAVIILLGGIGVLGYTQDKWLLLPAALGAYVGTFCTVKRHA